MGQRIRFFSPDELLIATATLESSDRFLAAWDAAELRFDQLDDCRFEGDRFITPTDAIEDAAKVARIEEKRKAREALAARGTCHDERRAAGAAREKREQEWAEWHRRQRAARLQAWQAAAPKSSSSWGSKPCKDVIAIELRSDWGTIWHPAHWHARLFCEFIQDRIGETFEYSHAIERFFEGTAARQAPGQRRAGWLSVPPPP